MVKETQEQMGRVFLAYGTPQTVVSLFCYLGQALLSTNDYLPAVECNIRRAQGKWGRLGKILGKKGADKRTAGRFFVVEVQVVLLFGFKTWVLTPCLEKVLQGSHHQAARQMAGMGSRRQRYKLWV